MRREVNIKLKSIAELKALVGVQIYRGDAPANTTGPYVTWHVIDNDSGETPINATRNCSRAIVTIEAWSTDEDQVIDISDVLIAQMPSDPAGPPEIINDKQFTFLASDDGTDDDTLTTPGSEQQLHNITQSWIVWHGIAAA